MSNPGDNITVIWVALLTRCESSFLDLSEAPPAHQECAEQMESAGILQTTEEHTYTLTTNGMKLLQLVENLRDYSLGIN